MNLLRSFRWLAPPARTPVEPPAARQAYFIAVAVVCIAYTIGILNLFDGFPTTLFIVGSSSPLLLLVLWLIGHHRTEAANFLLLSLLLVVLTIIISLENGIHDIGIILYPVIAILAGTLIGRRGLAIFLVLVTISVFFVVLGEVYEFLPLIHPPGRAWVSDGITITLIMAIAAVAIRWLMEAQEKALAAARGSEEALTDKVRKLQLLREISLLYARELDLRTLIKRIYELFPQYFPATIANVLIYDAAERGLVSENRFGIVRPERPAPGGVQYPGESISGKAYQSRQPILIDDCLTSNIISREWVERLRLRSCLAVPIIAQDQALGVLRLDNTDRPRAFSSDDVSFFEMLADQLAIGIQNQQLFEERQRTQAALAEGEARFRMLSENVTDVIWTSDMQLRFRYISDSVQKIFGWTTEEWLKHRPEDYLTQESVDIAQQLIMNEVARNAEPGVDPHRNVIVELQQRKKDGALFWTEVVARFLYDKDGRPEGIIGVTRDIDGRKLAEDRLRKSENSYRSLVENIPNSAIVLFDHDLRFVLVDGPETERTGLTKERLMGRTLFETFPPEYVAMFEPNMRAVISGTTFDAELPYGDLIYHYTYLPLRRPDGTVEYGMILAQNVTERRRAEEEVRRLNTELEQRVRDRTSQLERANQELEAFSYSVSHDLRAPIRHILGYLKLLEGDLGTRLTGESERLLRTVEHSAQRMAQLIDDLLRLSRLSRAEMRLVPTDLGSLAEMTWSRLAAADPLRTIDLAIAPTATVTVDPGLMEVLLENLFSNARKFTSKTAKPHIEFGQMPGDGNPVFYVRDNGAGFDMAYASKLFGVFQRLHDSDEFPGTGIGLATVHRILERHRGRIWAEGEVDRGATFYFTLPTA